MNITHIDEGALNILIENLNIKSVIDVGCGPAGMSVLCKSKGLKYYGVDGDPEFKNNPIIHLHDYYEGPLKIDNIFDLGWSVEFLEHIDEKYLPNIFDTFSKCKHVFITHALPHETGGHNHVNCRTEEYWNEKFKENNFNLNKKLTEYCRKNSTMYRDFVRNTGKVYINERFI